MTDKIYESEVVQDQPFPNDLTTLLPIPGPANTKEIISSPDITPKPLPLPTFARHLISESLNTQERRIKQSYEFSITGALQIGSFKDGIAGEVKLSRDGLVAKDVNGLTTVSIDGSTGNATFKGTLQAGTIIAGDSKIIMETSALGNGRIVFLVGTVPVILIGDPS